MSDVDHITVTCRTYGNAGDVTALGSLNRKPDHIVRPDIQSGVKMCAA